MTLPKAFLDELLARVSISRIVGRKVTWDSRRSNLRRGDYWAPCPFHQEKTASFHVEEAKGVYYCFGCQAKGNAISFLRDAEGMGFMEAVETLAGEAGLALPERMPGTREREDRRSRLHAAMEAAIGYYRLQLATARAAEARAYLAQRRLTAETLERFEIGFAPPAWTALAEHLAPKGFTPDELLEAGLTKTGDNASRPYDRFRGRVIFPIRDAGGRALALGGRIIRHEEGAPKYLNSPETPLFDKGRTLFNHAGARAAMRKGGPLIVAEGYMDVIALVQAGFEAAVAPLGTAITADQLEQIWSIAPEPLVALDGDEAGLAAAHRLVELALPRLGAERSLRFMLLPPGLDPDDVVRSGGAEALHALVEASQPVVEFIWRRETAGQRFDSPERRAALDARLKAHLAKLTDPGLRAHTAAALRERRVALFGTTRPVPGATRRPPGAPLDLGPGGRARRGFLPPPLATAAVQASLLGRTKSGPLAELRVRESAILLGLINHLALAVEFEDRLERMTFVCDDLAELRDVLLSCLFDDLDAAATEGAPPARLGHPSHSGESSQSNATALMHLSPPPPLAERVAARLGHDVRARLEAVGHLRANPHLRVGADLAQARAAIGEEIQRHAAQVDRSFEVREAMEALAGGVNDEGVTWRLRQAIEAEDRAARDALAAPPDPDGQGDALKRQLQDMIDRQVWKKPGAIR